MADHENHNIEDEKPTEVPKGQEGTQAADLNKMDQKGDKQDTNVSIDASTIKNAMANLTARLQEQKNKQKERKEQLSKVSVKREDIDTIIQEFDIPKDKADTLLRENNGDVVKVMEILINE